MSSSQNNTYKVTLEEDRIGAAVYGFRRTDENGKRYQLRVLNSKREVEGCESEMWLYGFNVSVQKVSPS